MNGDRPAKRRQKKFPQMDHVAIRIVYPPDNSTSTIDKVPLTCSIRTVRSLISKINKMASPDPIQVAFAGRVLDDTESIADIADDGATEVTISVTGVAVRQPETAPIPIHISPALFLFLTLIGLAIVFAGLVIWIGPKSSGIKGEIELQSVFCPALTLTVGMGILIGIAVRHLGVRVVAKCAIEFVACFLPIWDGQDFKRRHQLR
jgi:hypothetical protein